MSKHALSFSAALLLFAAAAPAQQSSLEFGTSGGSIADSSKLYCCGGTLGSLLNINGVNYILSNNHVLARVNRATLGESIIHPGLIDQTPVCDADAADIVGTLAAFKPIIFGKSAVNRVDAAIGLPSVPVSSNIAGIGAPAAWPDWREPVVGLAVRKSGRTTGVTSGTIASVNVTVNVGYQANCGMGKQQTAKFVNQFRVTPGGFSAGGDSGSLIVDTSSPAKAVGLLFAGSSTDTIGNRMDDVVAALTGVAPAAATATSSQQQRAAGIARIKDRYDDFLLSLPEAVGHGVGASETNPNELVIQLFVRKKNESIRRAAPKSLEGVTVELVETGEIRAVPAAVARCRK